MSKQSEEFVTWFYRTLIGLFSAATLAVVSAHYHQFQTLRDDMATQKVVNVQVDYRLTKLEK